MENKEYYDNRKHEILENKKLIYVFKMTLWNRHLKFWKSFSKEYYKWIEDEKGKMFIIIQKKELKETGVIEK